MGVQKFLGQKSSAFGAAFFPLDSAPKTAHSLTPPSLGTPLVELNWGTWGQNWVKLGQMGSNWGTGPEKGAKIGETAAPDVIGLVPDDSKTIRRHSGPLRGEYGTKPV